MPVQLKGSLRTVGELVQGLRNAPSSMTNCVHFREFDRTMSVWYRQSVEGGHPGEQDDPRPEGGEHTVQLHV